MEAAYLPVARFRKPHGLKGDALVFPLTDEPEAVFVAGRVLSPVDEQGHRLGDDVVLRKGRPYQRHWLLAFEGIDERGPLESWTAPCLGARVDELTPPADDEMYYHEIPGVLVVEDGERVGIAKDVVGVPGGEMLVVDRDGRDVLIPFRAPIVRRVDRPARRIEVVLPNGLLDL